MPGVMKKSQKGHLWYKKNICNYESAKVISRQNVWKVNCLLLMVYDEVQETKEELRTELLNFQVELEEIERSGDPRVGI